MSEKLSNKKKLNPQTHRFEFQAESATLLVVNVQNEFVGMSITEFGPKTEMIQPNWYSCQQRPLCRCSIELRDLCVLKELRRFVDQQIKRMEENLDEQV